MEKNQNVTDSRVLSTEGSGAATSLSLLERVKTQDEAAWQRLNSLYEPLVTQWCRSQQLQDADLADVRQEVFLAVLRTIGTFRREPPHDSFRDCLRTITRHKIIDHWRRRQQQPASLGGDSEAVPMTALAIDAPVEESSLHEEKSLLYRRALELLQSEFEAKTWQAFWRTIVDSQTPQDVAVELQTTANAVYLARSRVLKRLREEFADLIDR